MISNLVALPPPARAPQDVRRPSRQPCFSSFSLARPGRAASLRHLLRLLVVFSRPPPAAPLQSLPRCLPQTAPGLDVYPPTPPRRRLLLHLFCSFLVAARRAHVLVCRRSAAAAHPGPSAVGCFRLAALSTSRHAALLLVCMHAPRFETGACASDRHCVRVRGPSSQSDVAFLTRAAWLLTVSFCPERQLVNDYTFAHVSRANAGRPRVQLLNFR